MRWSRKRPSSAHSNVARAVTSSGDGSDTSRSHSPMKGFSCSSISVSSWMKSWLVSSDVARARNSSDARFVTSLRSEAGKALAHRASAPLADLDSTAPMAIADRNGGAAAAPPQNLEAEQSVLGAVLLSDTALPALIIDERLQPEDFYREATA